MKIVSNIITIFCFLLLLSTWELNAQPIIPAKAQSSMHVEKAFFDEQLPIPHMLKQLHFSYPEDTLAPHILELQDSMSIYTYTPENTTVTTHRLYIIPIWQKNRSCIYHFSEPNISPSYEYMLLKENDTFTILNGHDLSTDLTYIIDILAKDNTVIEVDPINRILSIYIRNAQYLPHSPPLLRAIKYQDSTVVDSYYPPRVLPDIQKFKYP